MQVAVFGGGIAGLTAAHELQKAGAEVVVYEMDRELGGFAKSSWDGDIPTEHSWRGYAPFYANAFDIMRRIPLPNGGTVYDNLSLPIRFIHPRDASASGKRRSKLLPRPTRKDKWVTSFRVAKAMAADRRPYTSVGYADTVLPGLSRDGQDAYIRMVGPGLGLDINTVSLHHAAWFAHLRLQGKYAHSHDVPASAGGRPSKQTYAHDGRRWHVMNKPTSEAWFGPWETHLKALGVRIVTGAELTHVDVRRLPGGGYRVTGCRLRHASAGVQTVRAAVYILCMDPYSAAAVARRSSLRGFAFVEQLAAITRGRPHNQISFRMVLPEGAGPRLPPLTVIAMPDTEFNITICPQELFFTEPFKACMKGRVWSGTACITDRPGRLFGLPAEALTRHQFEQEVVFQVTRSQELGLAAADIVAFEVWKDWEFAARPSARGRAFSKHPKWVNGLGTFEHRPPQTTGIPNLLLAGAHTKTSMDIWSMEGAVESGKLAAAAALCRLGAGGHRVPVVKHVRLPVFVALARVDNVLYGAGLPNILDCLVFVVLAVLILLMAGLVARTLAAPDERMRPRTTTLAAAV